MSNLNELHPIVNLNPFARFCCTIGNLPTSYMASLTYEEQLLWFCDYLQNTIIPAVNNNAECVKELQELYVKLKNYVNNYFENLDVQNEIDTKLDKMAQDGTLYDILNQINNQLKYQIDKNSNDIALLNTNKANLQDIINLQSQINNLLIESGNSNEEVLQARDNEETLNDRITKIENGKRIKLNLNDIDLSNNNSFNKIKNIFFKNTRFLTNNFINDDNIDCIMLPFKKTGITKITKQNLINNINNCYIVYPDNNNYNVYRNFNINSLNSIWLNNDDENYFIINNSIFYNNKDTNISDDLFLIINITTNTEIEILEYKTTDFNNVFLTNNFNFKTYFAPYSNLIDKGINLNELFTSVLDFKISGMFFENDKIYIRHLHFYENELDIDLGCNSLPSSIGQFKIDLTKNGINKFNFIYVNPTNENSRIFQTDGYIILNVDILKNAINNLNLTNNSIYLTGDSVLSPTIINKNIQTYPNKIYCVENNLPNIYFKNAFMNYNLKPNLSYCQNSIIYNNRYFTPSYNSNAYYALFEFFDNYYSHFLKNYIYCCPKNKNKDLNCKCLVIGDSLTDSNNITYFMNEFFNQDPMNIEFLGTRGDENYKHEGRAGWSAYDYVNQQNVDNIINPFYSPLNSKFDFNYYLSQYNIKLPDCVFIELGINDISKNHQDEFITNIEYIINSIHQVNSNIKIIICGIIPPYLGEHITDVSSYSPSNGQYNRILLNNKLINKFYNLEKQNIYTCPINFVIDTDFSFPLEEKNINQFSNLKEICCTDRTHPSLDGYKQIAQEMYATLKYIV